jgi:DNA polymerase elongation subunit (family B)
MLVKKLDDKMKLLDLVYTFAYDSGVNYIDSLTTVRSWDVIIHNYLLDNKIVIPQRPQTQKGRSINGAYVKDPLVGMHKSIVSFDITSLYPSLIMQYNISPDTLRGKLSEDVSVEKFLDYYGTRYDKFCKDNNVCLTANGCFYRKDKQGFIAILIEQLLNLKKQYEQTKDSSLLNSIAKYDILQMATKIKLNSLYGALSNEYFRWFDIRLAESITITGQLTIRWAERYINKYLNEQLGTANSDYCIAIDTDSLYCDLEAIVSKFNKSNKDPIVFLDDYCKQNIQPLLDKIYRELGDYMNCYKHAIYMKRESISDSGIFVAKKRYVLSVHNNEGVQYDKPKLKMMGIEAVRSSTPMACRQAIKQLLEVILHKDEQSTIEFIEQFKKEFTSKQFEEIAFPRGVNNLNEYHDSVSVYKKATPIHVRGALLYNKLLAKHQLDNKYQMIFDKDKIKFCYLVMPNPINENVISVPGVLPKQFGLDNYLDYQLMFEKSFLEPIKTVLDCIGWQTEKRNTVRGFFQ